MLHYITTYTIMFILFKSMLLNIFPNKSDKWINNLISGIHSVVVVAECHIKDNFNYLRYFSIVYFMFDLINYEFPSMFSYHHILTSGLLYYVDNNFVDKDIFITCYKYVELGNFPVYIMYGIIKSETNINKSYYKLLLYWEFVWFIFFRIIIVTYLSLFAKSYFGFLLNIPFQFANINWSVGIYKKIRA